MEWKCLITEYTRTYWPPDYKKMLLPMHTSDLRPIPHMRRRYSVRIIYTLHIWMACMELKKTKLENYCFRVYITIVYYIRLFCLSIIIVFCSRFQVSCEETGQFPCFDGLSCYPNSSRCDGVYDCPGDWGDEQGCKYQLVRPSYPAPVSFVFF